MVCELAEYEKSRHEVQPSEELFAEALFCDEPAVWCSILEHHHDDNADQQGADWVVAGFAVWFKNFFTWTAKHSLGLSRWMSQHARLSPPSPSPMPGSLPLR